MTSPPTRHDMTWHSDSDPRTRRRSNALALWVPSGGYVLSISHPINARGALDEHDARGAPCVPGNQQ